MSSQAPPAASDDAVTWLKRFARIGESVGSSSPSDWAQHELYGYPVGVELPYYRRRPVASAQDGDPESLPGVAATAGPDFAAELATNDARLGLVAILDRRTASQSVDLVKGAQGSENVSAVALADEIGAEMVAAVQGRVIIVRDEFGLPDVTADDEVTKKQAERAVEIALTPPQSAPGRSNARRSSGSRWSEMWSTVTDLGTALVDFLGSHF